MLSLPQRLQVNAEALYTIIKGFTWQLQRFDSPADLPIGGKNGIGDGSPFESVQTLGQGLQPGRIGWHLLFQAQADALGNLLQFHYIARPGACGQAVSVLCYADDRASVPLGGLGGEMRKKQRDVGCPFGEAGHPQRHASEPMEQIGCDAVPASFLDRRDYPQV